MDLKPIVTNFGDESLYQDLSKDIERRLPQKSVNWKRTYGREAKTVNIKATFTKFNSDQLGVTTDGTVTKQPFLHLYWTSCVEHDEFRNKVRQKIVNWQDNLKSRDISDWLIIQVVYEKQIAARNKTLLPRSSVFDKIKNELCGKNSARIIQFWEPKKEDLFTKSRDSWTALLNQLRELLLASISKHLTKFEEKVRRHREKYADPSWSFVEYLKLNEELATIFKSVTLHYDALVQYDELDALFSQFVVNGQIKGIPPWMKQFTILPSSWDGVSLNKHAVQYFRDAVYEDRASLIDIRNYIFIRQWQMLVNTHKGWDVAHRLLEFLFTVVNEMKILQPGLSCCIPACWVISCCLEYMHSVENKEFSSQKVMASLAQVLDYAREKLFLLGQECRLLPGEEPAKELVADVVLGLCKSQPVKEGNEVGTRSLLNALNSKTNFDKLYLRTCGRTKSLFSSVGRLRFANRVGIDMAKYYIMKHKYGNAEMLFRTALSEFNQSNWTGLYIDVLEPLATCQAEVESFDNYLRSLAALACAGSLSLDKRMRYAERFLHSTLNEAKKAYSISTDPILTIEDVKIDVSKEIGHVGETINVVLTLRNNMLIEIRFDEIEIRMRYTETGKVRLSSVDGEFSSLQRKADRVNWSELFNEQPEPSSPSNPKSGLLQRIKSRRIVKQKDNGSRDTTDNSPIASSPGPNENENDDVIINKFFSSPLAADRPRTLAEIAKELPRSLSMSDNSDEGKSERTTQPIAIPNGGIDCRCDSAASSLSVVSISSSSGPGSSNDVTTLAQRVTRQNVVSSLALNDNSNIDTPAENDTINEDSSNSMFHSEEDESKRLDEEEIRPELALDECHGSQGGLNFEVGCNEVDCEEREEDDFENGNEEDDDVDSKQKISAKFDLGSDKLDDEDVEEDVMGVGVEENDGLENKAIESSIPDNEDCFEIEEEIEIQPTKSLLSGPALLAPGTNTVTVKAKVMHVGRYNLQTLLCQIGNIYLYNLLGLPRQSRAFFIVSDPPKFSWASTHIAECLLLGNKQRIHVTLSNGPGFIHESSVIQLSSSTGLEFSPVPPSSVMVYSTNKKEEPREGAMHIESSGSNKNEANLYLPKCGPYEQVDLYFDAYAPVENADLFDHMAKHEISLKCLWLTEYVLAETKLESLFYEPFTIQHENLVSTNGNYLRTTLISLNPVQINIIKPELKCLNSEKFSFNCLTCDIQMSVQANEELSLIWHVEEIDKEKQSSQILLCRLKVNFKTEVLICELSQQLLQSWKTPSPLFQCVEELFSQAWSEKRMSTLLPNSFKYFKNHLGAFALFWFENSEAIFFATVTIRLVEWALLCKGEEESGEFSKQFEVTNVAHHILTVETALNSGPENYVYKGSSYDFDVKVRNSSTFPSNYENGEIICTLVDNDQWKYDDDVKSRKREIHSIRENFDFSFTTKAIPCVSGPLRLPVVALTRVLDSAAEDLQDELSQTRKHHVTSGLTNRLSSSRRTSAGASDKLTQPFSSGEIIFINAGQFINVLQPKRQVSVL